MTTLGSMSTVGWGRGSYARGVNVVRAADTYANRQYLQAQAARDGRPSALVSLGRDVALLSGDALVTASRLAASPGERIQAGGYVGVDGETGMVLGTDDGFSEIDASHVVVAVVDTGIDVTHPAFQGRLVQGINTVDNSNDVTDTIGHGTHVAGIVAGGWGQNQAAGGVAPNARIMPIKAADASGNFSDISIANGIHYAVAHGARIINLSLRGTAHLPYTQLAVEYAALMGVLVVAASGNDGQNNVSFPAIYDGVLAVGSSRNGVRSSFSNGGAQLDLTAPGENVLAPQPGNRYGNRSGTSMSSPMVAGAAALVMARHPEWTAAQVEAHLERTAVDRGRPGKDGEFGYGELDLFKAVYGLPASGYQPAPQPLPQPYPRPYTPAPPSPYGDGNGYTQSPLSRAFGSVKRFIDRMRFG